MRRLTELLYPERCMLCGTAISAQQNGLCEICRSRAQIELRQMHCVPPEQLDALVCAGAYRGAMRDAMIAFKFHARRSSLMPLTQLMAQAWEYHAMPRPDLVTSVPISTLRAHTRGYNQSEAFAHDLAKRWDVPEAVTLKRRILSRRQSELAASERWDHARKAFLLCDGIQLQGKQVLLVDDIVTTGATISICAGLLRQAGAAKVWALAATQAGENN